MATSSAHPTFPSRYTSNLGGGRAGGSGAPQGSFNTPAGGFGSTAKTQQRLEAERIERERNERAERERMERAGQSQLGELSEEQREEINEAVSKPHYTLWNS